MRRPGLKIQVGDIYFPKKRIPVDVAGVDYIYPNEGSVVVVANLGKKDNRTEVIVQDSRGRVSKKIKAMLYLAKHPRA